MVEELNPETPNSNNFSDNERKALDIIIEMCQAMELDITPELTGVNPPYMEINLTGNDAAEAFGRYGKRLDALQYLSNLVISKRVGADVRVVLDCAGYRLRRTQVLENLAREYAAQVKDRQEECELDPLPAHERRIIHNTLSDDPSVITYSEGVDPDRKVVIAPR